MRTWLATAAFFTRRVATKLSATAALLFVALTLIERNERRARPDGPPWPGTPAS